MTGNRRKLVRTASCSEFRSDDIPHGEAGFDGKQAFTGSRPRSFRTLLTVALVRAAYPQITVEDLRACLKYAAALAADEVVLTEA
jgi:hypothetical protein